MRFYISPKPGQRTRRHLLFLVLAICIGTDLTAQIYTATANGPQPSVGLYWIQNSDPTQGGGVNAPLNQLLFRTDTASIYYKSGAANTAWTRLGNGASVTAPVQSVTGAFPLVVTSDAGVYNVAEQLDPAGGLTVTDAGLAVNIQPDGGLEITASRVKLSKLIDVDQLKVHGVTLFGPPNTNPLFYSSAGGTLGVVQTTTPETPGSMVVDLTAIGTTDYLFYDTAAQYGRKIGGTGILNPVFVYAGTGSIATGVCTTCPFTINWTRTDCTAQQGSFGSSPTYIQMAAASTLAGFGIDYQVVAKTTTQVLRLYLSAGHDGNGNQICTGTLSDGSASPVTTPPIVSVGANVYFRQEWTFASNIAGAILHVYCRNTVPPSPPGGVYGVTLFAMALSPT